MSNQEFYIGTIFKINNDDFSAEINIFPNSEPVKNCKYYGFYKSEVKVGDQVFVTKMSRELKLYTPISGNPFIGISNGNSKIDLSGLGSNNTNTITIKADNVIVDSPNIKLGSNGATFTPLTDQDAFNFSGTFQGSPISGVMSFTGAPKSQKVKIE